jgi:hypothetical protein
MIRIDEIYNNTFWPWLERNRPGTRLFFCDPPGNTSPDALFNLGSNDIVENDYVFMHDQEPVDLELYQDLFDKVCTHNTDLWAPGPPEYYDNKPYVAADLTHWITDDRGRPVKPIPHGHVIVSERGEFVDALCQKYEWTPHYYFYHGWACLDWFRGYDQTFLVARARDRRPTQTFMSPNRIIGGRRDHRVIFLYHVFKNHLQHNHISAPRVCQYEGIDIASIAQKYINVYQDITHVLNQAQLPKLFAGESTQQMSSYWLSNLTEAQDSLVYVPTETVYFGQRTHLTEKTFKAIALEMPFVLVACAGSLEYLREYGFKTFSGLLDETYDCETDDLKRMEKVIRLLKDIDSLTKKERQQMHRHMLPVIEHNYNHFYRGGFADILWTELVGMLNGIKKH